MSNAVAIAAGSALMEQVVIGGNLAQLSPQDRLQYYMTLCDSLGLNPLTRPFEYISLQGKLVLYAKRDCTDQLRAQRKVSIEKLERELVDDCYVVTAYGRDATNRADSSIGAVSIAGLKGEARANAMMKAETKAKRRLTLSLCGLGMLDETEVETIPGAMPPFVAERDHAKTIAPRASQPADHEAKLIAPPPRDPRTEPGVITVPQGKRLWAMAAERAKALDGVDRTEIVRDVLFRRSIEHTTDVPRVAYESICAAIENWEPPVALDAGTLDAPGQLDAEADCF